MESYAGGVESLIVSWLMIFSSGDELGGDDEQQDADMDGDEEEPDPTADAAAQRALALCHGHGGDVVGVGAGLDSLALLSRTRTDATLDATNLSVAEYFVGLKTHVGNSSLEASGLGVDRKKLRRMRSLTASAAVHMERHCWSQLADTLAEQASAGKVKLLCYMEFLSYDGLDLKVATKSCVRSNMAGECVAVQPPGAGPPDGGNAERVSTTVEKAVGTTKLLNGESAVAMLVEAGGQLTILYGDFLTWLQSVNKNSGEAILAALRAQDVKCPARDRFERKIRFVTTDAAAYNFRAERGMMASRPDWTLLHLRCDIHVIASIHASVYGSLEPCVAGMVAVSLTMCQFGQIQLLRAALKRVLGMSLRLVYRPPCRAARAYREWVVNTFLGTSARFAALRLVLGRCASGDWRKLHTFEFLAGPQDTKESVLHLLHTMFVPMILAHAPRIWPRNRWTGFDSSLQDLGLFACIHGLLPEAYRNYCEVNYPAPSAASRAPAEMAAVAVDGAAVDHAPAGAAGAVGAGAGPADGQDWASVNRAHRGAAMEWLRGDSRTVLLLMRMVLSPMMKVLNRGLELAGSACHTAQMHSFLSAVRSDDQAGLAWDRRHWPLLAAADCSIETTCLQEVASLHASELYQSVLPEDTKVETNHLLFRLLSREAGSVYQRLLLRHRCFPFKLFNLLTDPEKAESIAASCEPSLDAYSKDFLQTFKGQLDSQAAKMELAMAVLFGRTNTVRIESSNASIRRRVVAASVQAHVSELVLISGEQVLGKLRRRDHEFLFPRGSRRHWRRVQIIKPHTKVGGGVASDSTGRGRRRRGGGGTWRAFVSKRCKGVARAIFSQLARDYSQLSEQELEDLREDGGLATWTHRSGGHAFGLVARELSRAIAKRRLLQSAQPDDAGDLPLLPYGTTSKALAVRSDQLVAATNQARVDVCIFRKIVAKKSELQAEALISWRSGEALNARNQFVTSVPAAARFVPCLRSEPACSGAAYVMSFHCPLAAQVPRLLALTQVKGLGGFLDFLEEQWQRMHHVIRHEEQGAIPKEAKTNYKAKPSCLDAYFCLCGDRGHRIWALKLRFCAAMKKSLTRESNALVTDGFVILKVIGFDEAIADVDETEEEERQREPVCEFFVHISLMYWSPYRPTVRRMTWPGRKIDELRRLHLKATDTYQSLLEFLADVVDSSAACAIMQFFQLADSEEPIPALNPLWVLASPMLGCCSQKILVDDRPGSDGGSGALCDQASSWEAVLDRIDENAVPDPPEEDGVLSEYDEGDDEQVEHMSDLDASSDDDDILEDPADEDVAAAGPCRTKQPPNMEAPSPLSNHFSTQ